MRDYGRIGEECPTVTVACDMEVCQRVIALQLQARRSRAVRDGEHAAGFLIRRITNAYARSIIDIGQIDGLGRAKSGNLTGVTCLIEDELTGRVSEESDVFAAGLFERVPDPLR